MSGFRVASLSGCYDGATGYRMRPINNSTLFVLASHASRVGRVLYCSCESHHPRSSDESSRNCILMFGFKLSELLHYLYVYVYIIQQVLNLRPATHPHKDHILT